MRLVYTPFPIERIHPWAVLASGFALCIDKDNSSKTWQFRNMVFDEQGETRTVPVLPSAVSTIRTQEWRCIMSSDSAVLGRRRVRL